MPKIPKDVAERVYGQYEITLQDPMLFEEMFTPCAGGMFEFSEQHKHAYSRGSLKPEGQLNRIRNLHKKEFNPSEPYDIGVFNALELVAHIYGGKGPEFVEKPESVKDLKERVSEGKKELGATKRALAAAKRTIAERVKELSQAVKGNAKKASKSSKKGS